MRKPVVNTLFIGSMLVSICTIQVGCARTALATLRSKYLINSVIPVKPDQSFFGKRLAYYDVPFQVTTSMMAPTVQGNITDNDGWEPYSAVYVFDDSSFNNWINRTDGVVFLYSASANMVSTLNVSITTPGIYHLVMYVVALTSPAPGGGVIDKAASERAHVKLQWYQ